jgi:hypothetical protein
MDEIYWIAFGDATIPTRYRRRLKKAHKTKISLIPLKKTFKYPKHTGIHVFPTQSNVFLENYGIYGFLRNYHKESPLLGSILEFHNKGDLILYKTKYNMKEMYHSYMNKNVITGLYKVDLYWLMEIRDMITELKRLSSKISMSSDLYSAMQYNSPRKQKEISSDYPSYYNEFINRMNECALAVQPLMVTAMLEKENDNKVFTELKEKIINLINDRMIQ